MCEHIRSVLSRKQMLAMHFKLSIHKKRGKLLNPAIKIKEVTVTRTIRQILAYLPLIRRERGRVGGGRGELPIESTIGPHKHSLGFLRGT